MQPISTPMKVPVPVPVKTPIQLPTKATIVPTTTIAGNIVHRINCGSTNQVVVPPNNIVWTPDQYASSGLSFNTCGTITTSIYCTSRYYRAADPAPHRYSLPVFANNRAYTVRLHFAEQVGHWFATFLICKSLFLLLLVESLTHSRRFYASNAVS